MRHLDAAQGLTDSAGSQAAGKLPYPSCYVPTHTHLGSSTLSQLDSASPPSPLAHRAAARAARMSGKSGYFLSRFLRQPEAQPRGTELLLG